MKQYQRIGVFLTGSPADQIALGYAGSFAKLAASEKIVCVYVHGGGPESTDDPKVGVPELRERVLRLLPADVSQRTEVEVHQGQGFEDILITARDGDLDLIVKGRRLPAHQAAVGAAFTKLARKSPCSVLLVPNYCRPHFSRVLVPVDFSDHSKLSLRAALDIARAGATTVGSETPQVLIQHVASVGYGYQKLGVTFEQAMQQQEQAFKKRVQEFLVGVDYQGIELESFYTCSEDIAAAVHDLAAARKMDMIVIGSRGLTAAAAAILGSTAEQVLLRSPQPVMIVKEKGETHGLLDALLGS